MKKWSTPQLVSTEIRYTEKQHHQNGNTHGKVCVFEPNAVCNAQGNGKGICNGCFFNPNKTENDPSNSFS